MNRFVLVSLIVVLIFALFSQTHAEKCYKISSVNETVNKGLKRLRRKLRNGASRKISIKIVNKILKSLNKQNRRKKRSNKLRGSDDEESLPNEIEHNEKVTFKDISYLRAKKGRLEKIAGGNRWNGGAISKKSFDKQSEVQGFSFKAGTVRKHMMIGLSHGNSHEGFDDIDHAFYLHHGSFSIYEKGEKRGNFGKYKVGDKFEIVVHLNKVYYKKNGYSVYRSSQIPRFPLSVDTSFHSIGAIIYNIKFIKGFKTSKRPKKNALVQWGYNRGLSVKDGKIKNTRHRNGWNNGVSSIQKIDEDSNVHGVSFRADNTQGIYMIGLSTKKKIRNHVDISFAIYCSGRNIVVYENGQHKGHFGKFKYNDKLSVIVEGNKVKYLKNGEEFYNSNNGVIYPLYVAASFHRRGDSASRIRYI